MDLDEREPLLEAGRITGSPVGHNSMTRNISTLKHHKGKILTGFVCLAVLSTVIALTNVKVNDRDIRQLLTQSIENNGQKNDTTPDSSLTSDELPKEFRKEEILEKVVKEPPNRGYVACINCNDSTGQSAVKVSTDVQNTSVTINLFPVYHRHYNVNIHVFDEQK